MDKDTANRPLDELMLAMDVVDTLRHREILVERELHAEGRDQKLIGRLREIYASQGIEVPDHVLQEGVEALTQERFVYTPPKRSLSVIFAQLLISQGKWLKRAAVAGLLLAVLAGGISFFLAASEDRLPQELAAQRDAAVAVAVADSAKEQVRQRYNSGMAALRAGDLKEAKNSAKALESMRAHLEQAYELRIVSRPTDRSGVWRVPDVNSKARNYYLIVEAVTAGGQTLSLPIVNEEDGKTYRVNKWGLRVDQQLFERVAADKQDDGIIQNRRVGVKRRGDLDPEYLMRTNGAAITKW